MQTNIVAFFFAILASKDCFSFRFRISRLRKTFPSPNHPPKSNPLGQHVSAFLLSLSSSDTCLNRKKTSPLFGLNTDQMNFMTTEKLILVDRDDNFVGADTKKAAHTFDKSYPRGSLHRAFSVFLFNSEGKLLLQQRAAEKITFPKVWTNTCCSHQLFGYSPNEFDDEEAISSGRVEGAKAAAIRKLEHELGITSPKVNIENFKFLTRLHYWAADVLTHGKNSPWGEHEIDYILFIQATHRISILFPTSTFYFALSNTGGYQAQAKPRRSHGHQVRIS